MLKHALDYQSPQVVLLETNMLFRYTNTPDSLRSSISDTAMYYFPVLQYHNLWKNIVNDQIPEGWQSYKGFAIRSGVAAYSKGSYLPVNYSEDAANVEYASAQEIGSGCYCFTVGDGERIK